MRVHFSRPIWLNVGILSLSVASLTGCKSMPAPPGLGWLGWWSDPRPTASSLSGTPPSKPSVANLPPPSASTNQYGQYGGQQNSLGSYPSGTGVNQPAATNPSNYNVGPYAMAGANHAHASHAPSGAAPSQNPYGSYGAAGGSLSQPVNQTANQTPAYGGYQSPYATGGASLGGAANGAAANGLARTADSRNAYPASDSTPKLNPYTPQTNAAPSNNWNDNARSPGGFSATSGVTNDTLSQSPPRGYTSTPAGYNQSGGAWTPADGGGLQSAAPDRLDPAAAESNAAPRRDGAFRPGSTGRTGSTLPLGGSSSIPVQPSSLPGNTGFSTNYPSTNYPSTGYPSLSTPERTASESGYTYPSMPQMR